MALLAIALLSACGNPSSVSTPAPTPPAEQASDTKIYSSEKLGFHFEYPAPWILTPHETADGTVVSLRDPNSKQEPTSEFHPFADEVVVSFWPTVNHANALGTAQGTLNNYKDLGEALENVKGFKRKIGETTVDGRKAYEILLDGLERRYAVMVEQGGVYEIHFPTAPTEADLNAGQQKLLSSFAFDR